MASDKFGNNPVAPLYNATGRNPRDLDMGNPGKPLGSVGSSGAGGKDFGISNRPAQTQPLGQGMMSPFHTWGPNSMYQTARDLGKGKKGRGGGGGGGGDYSNDPEGTVYDAQGRRVAVDAMERTKQDVTINFAEQIGGDDNSKNRNVKVAENATFVGDDYAENDINKDIEMSMETSAPTASAPPAAARGPRTAEQKAATAAKRAKNKEANPNYGKRNPNRTPKDPNSPLARKPRTPKPQASGNATQRVGNIVQTMGNF